MMTCSPQARISAYNSSSWQSWPAPMPAASLPPTLRVCTASCSDCSENAGFGQL